MIQFALMAAIVVAGVVGPNWPGGRAVVVIGVVVALAGAWVAASAARALGRDLTPFPRPSRGATLVERGPYRVVRHPVYSGGILSFVGVSLVLSPVALAVTVVLAIVWALKVQVEEKFLRAAYTGSADYCARTPARLVPFVY